MAIKTRKEKRIKRQSRARKKILGTGEKPRLVVFRSNKHIAAQVVNDVAQETLCAANTYSPEAKSSIKGTDKAGAEIIGKMIAEKAVKKGIKNVVFDCGGNLYHGRVKALADAARKAGLEF